MAVGTVFMLLLIQGSNKQSTPTPQSSVSILSILYIRQQNNISIFT